MKTRNKKGFTIVELVIVIAVIGILTAILVPVFINLTNKANEASDNSLVKNLNTALRMEEQTAGHKKAPTLQGAIDDLENQGYLLENLQSKSGLDLLWDQEDNQFLLNKDGVAGAKYWKIVDTLPGLDQQVYSYYAGQNFSANTVANVKYGFDVGDNENISSISYINETTEARNVSIRTNGGTLNINAPLDVVKQYGDADSVKVEAIKTSSLHVYGTIKYAEISVGRIAMETGSKVNHIHVNAKETTAEKPTEFNEVIIAKATGVDMPNLSRDEVEIDPTNGTRVVALQEGTEEVTPTTELDYVWLTKQGIYEQITVSNSKTDKGSTWVDTSDKSAETKDAAKQIANNIGRNENGQVAETTTVDEKEYNVTVDPETREIVVKDAETGAAASTEVAEKAKEQTVEVQPDKADVETGATLFAGGSGTKNNPFLIKTTEHIQNISELYQNLEIVENDANNDYSAYAAYKYADTNIYIFEQPSTKGFYYKVADGVTQLDCSNWTPVDLYGSFDGNNCKFINLDQTFFSTALNYYNYETNESEFCEISNCDFDVKVLKTASAAPIVFSAGPKVKFTNVNVSGRVEGQYISSFVGFGVGQFAWKNASYNPAISADYEFVNCHSTATLTCVSIGEGTAAGFFAHIYSGTGSTVKLTNSTYEGRMNVFTKTSNGFYINCMGSATITMDEVSASKLKPGTTNQYAEANVHIIAGNKNGKVSGYNAITENAVENASYAIATYMIGTNPGGIQGAYITERIERDGNTFTSVNAHRYDVVIDKTDSYFYKIDGNTIKLGRPDCTGINTNYIIFNQYDSSGNLLSSIMYAFGSTSTIQG